MAILPQITLQALLCSVPKARRWEEYVRLGTAAYTDAEREKSVPFGHLIIERQEHADTGAFNQLRRLRKGAQIQAVKPLNYTNMSSQRNC